MAKVDEESVKRILTEWIGKDRVFWEKKNKFGYPTFQCDQLERPDLLVLNGDYPIAIEVKYYNKASNVLDGVAQTLRYARSDNVFYANHQIIDPVCYVLATQHSLEGKLFGFENKKVPSTSGKTHAAQRGELPYTEYRYTFLALRTLWRFAEYERDVHGWTWDVGVGFLLSNVLNPGNVISTPMIQAKIDKQQFIKVI